MEPWHAVLSLELLDSSKGMRKTKRNKIRRTMATVEAKEELWTTRVSVTEKSEMSRAPEDVQLRKLSADSSFSLSQSLNLWA